MHKKKWFKFYFHSEHSGSWALALLIISTLVLTQCKKPLAKTYFVDFESGLDKHSGISKDLAWKRCPGMKGFKGSYRHEAGDRFIFKGGSIWPAEVLPFNIESSGTEGNRDVYTTDHAWYRGSAWSQPTFTGQHYLTQLLVANKQNFFTLNELKFIDYGTSGIENGGKAIDIHACSHYTIQLCTIAPQAWIGMYIHSYSGSTETEIVIDSNNISASGQAIVLAVEAPNTRMSKVTISNNAIHDLSSQIVGATHGDGIHTWNSVQNDHTQFISDLAITGNHFYGDFSCGDAGKASMSALIYLTDPGRDALISGNQLSYTKTTHFSSLIWVRYFDSVTVANNTLSLDTAQGGIGIIIGQGEIGKSVIIKNNNISGAKYCYYIYDDASPTIRIDNNKCETIGPTVAYWNLVGKTWKEWQGLGNDIRGAYSNSSPKSARELGGP